MELKVKPENLKPCCGIFSNNMFDNLMLLLLVATNGVVLAVEKKHKSQLYDEHSIHRIEMVTKNIGMVYSGMGPDFRYGFCFIF